MFDGSWLPDTPDGDVQAAFRADFELAEPAEVTVRIQAAANFRLWADGTPIGYGPLRYAATRPEYASQRVRLPAGPHRLAVQAAGGGLVGRMTPGLPSFLWVEAVTDDGTVLDLDWRCRRLGEYTATGLRSSPLLDWLEWLDEPLDPAWRTTPVSELDHDHWVAPVPATGLAEALGEPRAAVINLPDLPLVEPRELGRGRFREPFTGYRFDDPAMQFLLADLDPPAHDDHDGSWVRYDLGRIRIGHLELTVETDRPAVITLGYADRLDPHGRVAPVVALSTGPTRMIQRYAVAQGRSRIEPFGAIGGRYVEVRVTGDARIREAGFRDRDFLGPPRGTFECDDERLNQIWQVGLDTLRTCAEDVLVDSVRERGEWVGDVACSALDLIAAGWGDHRLVHRTLLHAAGCARADGLVAGCVPGEPIFHGTYAAQWINLCLRLADVTGDDAALLEFEPDGRANVQALLAMIDSDGSTGMQRSFVDWGYASEPDRPDTAVLLHVLRGLTAWLAWQHRLGRTDDHEVRTRRDQLAGLLRQELGRPGRPLGYHEAALGHLAGLVPLDRAVPVVHDHLRHGFPFRPEAPRLRDPARVDASVVTPYFTNYSMPVLLDAGRTDDAIGFWKQGWGWMLDRGATTWWEVFDDRWSHCHFWSGAPTWQLTRYVLGAQVIGGTELIIRPNPGSLERARGVLPIDAEHRVEVSWQRDGNRLRTTVINDRPLRVTVAGAESRLLDAGRHDFG
ncbi:hypothetical protein [Microlunatus sp. GCM10028923]|uniref:alpha-L-rhamnosidase-related protein n=1 Tax=Microlunatus sp. GCM10028923 TaxID=3273400 RepID=UPI003618BE2C